jgi:sensor histidine kinase regulating citrate/malate metabolism
MTTFSIIAITLLITLLVVFGIVIACVIDENDKFKKQLASRAKELAKASEIIHDLQTDVWDMSDEVQKLKDVRACIGEDE